MLSVRKVLAGAAIIIVAAVGGFALAHAVTTDGPDPKVDEPVVVRPVGDSDDDTSKSEGPRTKDKQKNNTRRDEIRGGGDRDDRDDRGRADDDDLTPVNPSPRTFDDDDDDDDDDRDDRDDD